MKGKLNAAHKTTTPRPLHITTPQFQLHQRPSLTSGVKCLSYTMECHSILHPTTIGSGSPQAIFHQYPRLPTELRHKIWTHYVEDATPQIYRFIFRYPEYMSRRHLGRFSYRAGDQLFLQPIESTSGPEEKHLLQPLRESMVTRYIASATCVQSRQVVLQLYPDVLTFRYFPPGWGWREGPPGLWPKTDRVGFPEYVLRFNGAQDIIVFHADWTGLEAAVEISNLRGSPFDNFLKMRHVGIAVHKLRNIYYRQGPPGYGAHDSICTCETEECEDYCKKEPLPSFLSLFPRIEKFYIAGVPSSSTHQPGDQILAKQFPSGNANCPCPNEGPRHSWPLIKSSDACGSFVIYDKRSTCPFPKFDRVEELRQL